MRQTSVSAKFTITKMKYMEEVDVSLTDISRANVEITSTNVMKV